MNETNVGQWHDSRTQSFVERGCEIVPQTRFAETRKSVFTAKMSVIGIQVVDRENEDLGTLEDLVIDPSVGRIAYAVLVFRSLNDLSEKYFAIAWSELTFDLPANRAVLNVSKKMLEHDAGFNRDNWPTIEDVMENMPSNMGW